MDSQLMISKSERQHPSSERGLHRGISKAMSTVTTTLVDEDDDVHLDVRSKHEVGQR